jgi:hypothetical protein
MNLAAFFRPQTGLLGNSIIGNALRGGLAGLAGSTGYKGFGALGQGAMSAVDAARQRQATQIAPIQAGQQYQAGQAQIAQNNLQLAQLIAQHNVWSRLANPNAPLLTLQQVQNDPNALAQLLSNQAVSGMPGAPATGSAPATQAQVGMQPVTGGGTNVNPQVAQAYGSAASTAAPTPQAPQTSQAQTAQNDPLAQEFYNLYGMTPQQYADIGRRLMYQNDPRGQQMIDQAAKYDSNIQYQVEANKARAQAENANVTPRANAPLVTIRNGAPSVIVAPSIDESGATGYNVATGTGTQHITTGLPLGVPEEFKAAEDRNTQVQNMYAGSASAERQNVLQRMLDLANGPTKYGPGQEAKAYWTALSAVIPGISPDTSDEANMEVFKKYASTLGAQYQQATGGQGTDKQLENALERVPSPDKLNAAIKELVPYLSALEAAGQGNVNARQQWVQTYGRGGKSLIDFESAWRKAYDPRVYQYEQAVNVGQGSNWLDSNIPQPQRKAFGEKIKALMDLGAVQ